MLRHDTSGAAVRFVGGVFHAEEPLVRPMQNQCDFRFYEELNDFIAPDLRKRSFAYAFNGTPAVRDPIEALGVPHTEVDLILVDGASVDLGHRLRGGERVAVYPVFERLDLADVTRLRPAPLREPRFVLDVHLGRLAGYLRLLGFDCLYRNDYDDVELLAISLSQHRIVLSRDTGLLKRSELTHGAFVHAQDPRQQVREVLDRFQLHRRIAMFSRCGRCNGALATLAADVARTLVPTEVARRHSDFRRCIGCGQVYWPGSHLPRLRERLADAGISLGVGP